MLEKILIISLWLHPCMYAWLCDRHHFKGLIILVAKRNLIRYFYASVGEARRHTVVSSSVCVCVCVCVCSCTFVQWSVLHVCVHRAVECPHSYSNQSHDYSNILYLLLLLLLLPEFLHEAVYNNGWWCSCSLSADIVGSSLCERTLPLVQLACGRLQGPTPASLS